MATGLSPRRAAVVVSAVFAFLGGIWFPLGSGVMHDIGEALPSFWLVQASHVSLGGENVPVTYAGPQGELVGLDQVNVGPLPRTLIRRGEVEVVVTVEGKKANAVTVGIK